MHEITISIETNPHEQTILAGGKVRIKGLPDGFFGDVIGKAVTAAIRPMLGPEGGQIIPEIIPEAPKAKGSRAYDWVLRRFVNDAHNAIVEMAVDNSPDGHWWRDRDPRIMAKKLADLIDDLKLAAVGFVDGQCSGEGVAHQAAEIGALLCLLADRCSPNAWPPTPAVADEAGDQPETAPKPLLPTMSRQHWIIEPFAKLMAAAITVAEDTDITGHAFWRARDPLWLVERFEMSVGAFRKTVRQYADGQINPITVQAEAAQMAAMLCQIGDACALQGIAPDQMSPEGQSRLQAVSECNHRFVAVTPETIEFRRAIGAAEPGDAVRPVTPRDVLAVFVEMMEDVLAKHDASQGGPWWWRECSYAFLLQRLRDDVDSLAIELDRYDSDQGGCTPHQLWLAACNVANVAMMIADTASNLTIGPTSNTPTS